MQRGSGFNHLHIRKRIHKDKEKYPNPDKWKNLMDKFVYVIAVIGPFITLPQVFKIWVNQSANGISIFSWTGYSLAAGFWLLYGVIHKEKPIIFANITCLIMNLAVLIGALIYS